LLEEKGEQKMKWEHSGIVRRKSRTENEMGTQWDRLLKKATRK
jgi:hypothetical protein